MTPSDRDPLLKDEIIEAAQWIERFLERQTEETFIADEMVASAVMYKLQSIGEAVKRLMQILRQKVPTLPGNRLLACETFWFMTTPMLTERAFGRRRLKTCQS